MTRIVEIIDRSVQGATRPFICRGDDGEIYFVKGRHAGFRSLCCEWVAGELARRWQLPVAPFAIVEVPAALVRGSTRDDAQELGAGMAFGSRQVEGAVELQWSLAEGNEISWKLRARILLFDWWVANPDRTLSESGGNPNLLWTESDRQLHLIDHNLAFSKHMMPRLLHDYAENHFYGGHALLDEILFPTMTPDLVSPTLQATFDLANFWETEREHFGEIWRALPEEWTDAAPDFTEQCVRQLLDLAQRETITAFWGLEPAPEGE